MRKLLRKFLDGASIKSKNLSVADAIILCRNTDFKSEEFEKFFKNEKQKVIERDTKYENEHIRKTIRFSKSEYEKIEIEIKKTNSNFSNFAKSVLLKKQIKTKINQDYLIQLSRIGNNINQIAKYINTQKDGINNIKLLETLLEIERGLKK